MMEFKSLALPPQGYSWSRFIMMDRSGGPAVLRRKGNLMQINQATEIASSLMPQTEAANESCRRDDPKGRVDQTKCLDRGNGAVDAGQQDQRTTCHR